ncbi:MAG: MATE family efflux transporter [Oscillospiraceae bacterium]|nr:MATE family efflux transporter [Oscillospiraceae bacterium]
MENTLRENKMGTAPVGRLLVGMAVPMMISMLVQAFYNVVDSIFVAQISENALSAVSLAFPLQNIMIAFGGGTALGMNAILSRFLGEKNFEDANRAANTGIFLSIVSALVCALIGFFLTRPFFELMTDVEEIVNYGTDYASICLIFSIGIFSQFCFERLLQSTGKTTLSMTTQLIGAITNIILDPIFIFSKGQAIFGGAFNMPIGLGLGAAGAAWATIIGQIVAAIVAIILNVTVNREIKISLKLIRPDREIVARIYKIGFPSILMQSVGSVMNFCLNQILIGFSTTATAVFGAYFKLQSFIFMPVFGLNNGMIPIISYNVGAKKIDRVKKTIALSITLAMSIMAIGTLLFEFIPETLLGFFNASETMLELGVPALRVIATHFVIAGFCIIVNSVCQAIGNPMHSLLISICRQLLVLIPAAWLLSKLGQLNLVWLAFPIAEIASLILCLIFFKRTINKIHAEQ